MDLFKQLDRDPTYQALKLAREEQSENYFLAYKRYQQKLKRLERAKDKAHAELHIAHEANQAAMRACNEYYFSCGGPKP